MDGAAAVGHSFLSMRVPMPLEAVPAAAGVTSGDDGGLSICSRRGMMVAWWGGSGFYVAGS